MYNGDNLIKEIEWSLKNSRKSNFPVRHTCLLIDEGGHHEIMVYAKAMLNLFDIIYTLYMLVRRTDDMYHI